MSVEPSHIIALVGIGSLLLSVAVFVRAARWRDSDGAKELIARVDGCEDRITKIETRLEHVATKADMARLEEGISGVRETAKGVRQAVDRIESWLITNRGAA